MTCIHILLFFIGCFIGTTVSVLLFAKLPHGIAFLVGLPSGFFILFGFLQVLRIISLIFSKWRPLRPMCKNNKCTWVDYKYSDTTEQGDVLICACGDKYVRKGNTFSQLIGDGSLQPYMRYKPFGRWYRVMIIPFFSLLLLLGCGNADSHFKRVQRYLERNPVAKVTNKEMVMELDFFIDHAYSTLPFLQKKAKSVDIQEAITAQIILSSIARGMNEIKKRTGEKAAEELLGKIDVESLCRDIESVSTNGISEIWIQWRNVSMFTLQSIKAET